MATTLQTGSARTYTTIALALAAIPTTLDDDYIISCYNDATFTAAINLTGKTMGAFTITLTAAAGHSFQDHADVRTNALYYNQSNGVAIEVAGGSPPILIIGLANVTVSRLQFKRTSAAYAITMVDVESDSVSANVVVKDCILWKADNSESPMLRLYRAKAINCLVLNTGSDVDYGISVRQNYGSGQEGQIVNCTIVSTAAQGTGASSAYGNGIMKNTAIFGFAAPDSGTWTGTDYNATSHASGLDGANSLHSRVAADEFENATTDFRLKSGATLIDAGNTDATNAPNDISGTARGTTTDGDIGVWEFAAAGPTGKPMYYYVQL